MQSYKKILVALNPDEQGEEVVDFAARIAQMAGTEEVHFFHVADELDLPEPLCSLVEGEHSCQSLIDRMEDVVAKHFEGQAGIKLAYDASDGDQLKDLLSYIKKQDIDLVMVDKTCGGSKVPERLARKAPCSVFLVPPGAKATFGNIFVALDFSEQSAVALERALAFARASGSNKVTCVHVYSVPIGYHKTGRSYDEFAGILKDNARKEYDKFIEKIDTQGVETSFVSELHKQPVQGIADLVHRESADLLAVGARGRSKTMAILLGSVSERLIEVCDIPIITVKPKGQGMSFLEAVLDL